VQLRDNIRALPLVGTLDSERTQTVMENLLNAILTSRAEIAIIDITSVPTVATLVAQHLIKTVSAARLMGQIASSAAFVRKLLRALCIWAFSSMWCRRRPWRMSFALHLRLNVPAKLLHASLRSPLDRLRRP
jgi:hypothetical protein